LQEWLEIAPISTVQSRLGILRLAPELQKRQHMQEAICTLDIVENVIGHMQVLLMLFIFFHVHLLQCSVNVLKTFGTVYVD